LLRGTEGRRLDIWMYGGQIGCTGDGGPYRGHRVIEGTEGRRGDARLLRTDGGRGGAEA
jgi:hypothetical protein